MTALAFNGVAMDNKLVVPLLRRFVSFVNKHVGVLNYIKLSAYWHLNINYIKQVGAVASHR